MKSIPPVKPIELDPNDDLAPLRRKPRQARALERVERILDTAEQVFAEVGYDAATTNLIATQAGTSVGSLYEFFPNKGALAMALAERYTVRIGTLYDTLIVDNPDVTGEVMVERVVEALDEFYREHPGAVPLLNGRHTSDELAQAGAALQRAMVRRIEVVIAGRSDVSAPRRQLVAQVIAEISRSLLVLADEVPLHQRKAVVREVERAIIGYLRETLPDPATQTMVVPGVPGVAQ
jgi:AcrR family transcriptional regulator